MNKKQQQLSDEYVKALEIEINRRDKESAHIFADNLLCNLLTELGFNEVVGKYLEVDKWYA